MKLVEAMAIGSRAEELYDMAVDEGMLHDEGVVAILDERGPWEAAEAVLDTMQNTFMTETEWSDDELMGELMEMLVGGLS